MSAGVTLALGILAFFIRESRPDRILRLHAQRWKKQYDYESLTAHQGDQAPKTTKDFAQLIITSPAKLFFTEPLVFVITIMSAAVYALVYIFSEGIEIVYHEGFGLSIRTSAVIFLTLMIGLLPSLLVRIYDYHLAGKRQKQGQVLEPEDKLAVFLIAAPINAAALWWFAWTIPPHAGHLSPWVSIAALLPLGFLTNEFDQVMTMYLCDTYTSIAGSAAAPLSYLRAMLSAAYPLFATKMFTR